MSRPDHSCISVPKEAMGGGHASSKHRKWPKQAAGGREVRSDWLWDLYQRDRPLTGLEENEDLMFVCYFVGLQVECLALCSTTELPSLLLFLTFSFETRA